VVYLDDLYTEPSDATEVLFSTARGHSQEVTRSQAETAVGVLPEQRPDVGTDDKETSP
jgi:hypothetical protein